MNGKGVQQDFSYGFNWSQKAAKQGYADADMQNELAEMYEKGIGVKQDMKKAVYWYKKAAAQGDDIAKKIWMKCKKIRGHFSLILY